MRGLRYWVVVAVVPVLTGCSGDEKPPEEREHVWEEQVETMDKARDVERTLEDADERRRREIDSDTR